SLFASAAQWLAPPKSCCLGRHARASAAHPSVVAASTLLDRRRHRQVAFPQCICGVSNLNLHVVHEVVIHRPRLAVALIELINLDIVRPPTSELLIAERIDVKLRLRHLLRLRAISRFEINNRSLAGVDPAYKIDTSGDAHPVA